MTAVVSATGLSKRYGRFVVSGFVGLWGFLTGIKVLSGLLTGGLFTLAAIITRRGSSA